MNRLNFISTFLFNVIFDFLYEALHIHCIEVKNARTIKFKKFRVRTMSPQITLLCSFFVVQVFFQPAYSFIDNIDPQNTEQSIQQPLAPERLASSSSSFRADLLHLHRNLVNIESITYNEAPVGNYLASYLSSHNLTVEKQYLPQNKTETSKQSERFNIYAYQSGHPLPRVLLTSHIDVVPPYFPYEAVPSPKDPSQRRFKGRGSADAKASVAAQVTALRSLRARGAVAEGDVGLLFVVGEETGGDGMRFASKKLSKRYGSGASRENENASKLRQRRGKGRGFEAIIFGEPTSSRLASGHKGMVLFSIRATGRAAHSGYPWLGVSANSLLIRAMAAMEDLAERGGLPSSEKFGNSTLNVGRIDGGVAVNVVAEKSIAKIGIRLADDGGGNEKKNIPPNDTRKLVQTVVKNATQDLIEERGGECEVEFSAEGYSPVDLDTTDDAWFGKPITANFGTDVPNLKIEGYTPRRFLYGPGEILVAHSNHEYIDETALVRAIEGYERLVLGALRSQSCAYGCCPQESTQYIRP